MRYLLGNFALDNATLQVRQTPVRVSGSLLQLIIITHAVTGKLRAKDQNELHAKIGNFESAIQSGFHQAGLVRDNGSPTHHFINGAVTLDGIKLTEGPNYPIGQGAEYSVYRTVSFTLQAEIRNNALNLVRFAESIDVSGGTRRSLWHIPADERITPIRERLPKTPYLVTQSGAAESYSSALAIPAPLGEEPDEARRQITGPEFGEGKLATYKINWSYRWTTLVNPAVLRPNDRRL